MEMNNCTNINLPSTLTSFAQAFNILRLGKSMTQHIECFKYFHEISEYQILFGIPRSDTIGTML